LVVAVMLSLAPASSARPKREGNRRADALFSPFSGQIFRRDRQRQVFAELKLEADTIAKLSALVDAAKMEDKSLRSQRLATRSEITRLLFQEKPDSAAVDYLVDRLGKIESQQRRNRVKMMLSLRDVLGPARGSQLQVELAKVNASGPLPTTSVVNTPPAAATPPVSRGCRFGCGG
jgi:Spy/CpxP family protein refolding chaperone